MNKDTILDNWQEELKHVLGVCKCFDVPEADCPFGGGMTDEERYAKGRVFIASLLQAQRERDTEIVDDYIKFAENLHSGAHKDNQNMILYDAHSRIIACQHIKERILNQTKND